MVSGLGMAEEILKSLHWSLYRRGCRDTEAAMRQIARDAELRRAIVKLIWPEDTLVVSVDYDEDIRALYDAGNYYTFMHPEKGRFGGNLHMNLDKFEILVGGNTDVEVTFLHLHDVPSVDEENVTIEEIMAEVERRDCRLVPLQVLLNIGVQDPHRQSGYTIYGEGAWIGYDSEEGGRMANWFDSFGHDKMCCGGKNYLDHRVFAICTKDLPATAP